LMASVEAEARLPAPTLCSTTGAAPDPGWRYRSFALVSLVPGAEGDVPYLTGPADPLATLVESAATELAVLSSPVESDATPVESIVTVLTVVLKPVETEPMVLP